MASIEMDHLLQSTYPGSFHPENDAHLGIIEICLILMESDVACGCSNCGTANFCNISNETSWLMEDLLKENGLVMQRYINPHHILTLGLFHYILRATLG